jgi:predicted AlkP superfamily pyrophosphatase or phosphodiesterase
VVPPGSLKPDYGGYCLSNVPSTVLSLLGVDSDRTTLPRDAFGGTEIAGVENVVLMLFDGLGFRELSKQEGRGFFGSLMAKGSVRPITTVFPSTTAAALTTVSTGLTPQEHGLPEWFVYMDELDDVVVTLPFTRVGDSGRDTLVGQIHPSFLFDGTTIFERLKKEKVRSLSLTGRALAHTAYSKVSHEGSEVLPYATASDLAVSLRRRLEAARGRNLFYVYWSSVDTIEHIYGPNTAESEVEASLISHAFQEGLISKLGRETARRTMVIATADHGQINVKPENTVYLNGCRRLLSFLDRGPTGKVIPPWGSARDAYLRVRKDKIDEAKQYIEGKLAGIASVLKTEDAIDEGLFGVNKPSRKFRRRVGNLMVLPRARRTVWYHYEKGDSLGLKGHHGGLSRDEMTIPLATARVSDIQ